jgi:transposase
MSSSTTPAASPDHGAVRIGVDLGVRNLLAAAPASAGPGVDDALVVDGEVERALFEELGAVTRRLQAMATDTTDREIEVFETYQHTLDERFANAVAALWEYLEAFETPTVVLENIGYHYRSLFDHRAGGSDVGTWMLPAFQERLAAFFEAQGHRIEYVDPEGTTQECHVCDEAGERVRNVKLRCTNRSCPMTMVGRDRSAAVSIAKRREDD